jgi:sensor c-di-GMP phosphodiesterase-like protein
MGCDLGQGWLYGKAIPADQVEAMLLDKTDGDRLQTSEVHAGLF